jgi:hypothetical protein
VPYKSKAQMKKFFVMEREGELPKGTAEEWAHHTKDLKSLPEHVSEKKGFAMTLLTTLAAAAADRNLVEKLAEDSGFAPEQVEALAARVNLRPGAFAKQAYADPAGYIGFLKLATGSGKLTEMEKRSNLVLRMLSNAAKHMGKGLGNAAEAATGKDTNVGRAAVGGLAASGAGLGASGAAKMMGGAAAKANPAAQAAGPGGSAGSGGGAQNAPSPAASSQPPQQSSQPSSPPSPQPAAKPGVGLGTAAAIGAGGAALGAGGAMLAGRRKKQQQPQQPKTAEDLLVAALARAVEKKAADQFRCEAATGLCRYLDQVAGKMPLEKAAQVRVLQAEVGRGKDLVDAVKVAYPTLTGPQQGVLAYEIVKTAHAWLKAAGESCSGGTVKVRYKQEYSGKDRGEGMSKMAGIGEALLKIMKQRGAMGVLGAGAMGAAGGSMAANAITGAKAPSLSMPSASNLPKAPQVANPMTNVNKALGGR